MLLNSIFLVEGGGREGSSKGERERRGEGHL